MSTTAKVVVVLNLFFALILVGVQAAYLAEQDNWKTKFENKSDEHATVKSALEAEVYRHVAEKDDKTRLAKDLAERLDRALRSWESERTRNTQLTAEQQVLNERLASLEASFKAVDESITRVSEENSRLQGEILQRVEERDAAREAQEEAEEAFLALAGELEVAEGKTRATGEQLQKMTKAFEDKKLQYDSAISDPGGIHSPVAPPPIDGRVLAVSADVPLVLLSVGADDRVEKGHVFTVYRGSSYVTKVQVQDVFKDSASAKILSAYQKLSPREGDNVSTRIP